MYWLLQDEAKRPSQGTGQLSMTDPLKSNIYTYLCVNNSEGFSPPKTSQNYFRPNLCGWVVVVGMGMGEEMRG